MSIAIHGFLGPDTGNLEARVLQAFAALGFAVHYHPQSTLLESGAGGVMYMSFTQTPAHLNRIAPGTPLLLAFDYAIRLPDGRAAAGEEWPPRKVKRYSHEIATRTAAGRSRADYFAQALTVAILAKETGGYFYLDGDEDALSGRQALERVVTELNRPRGYEFDADAHPFEAWPPLAPDGAFVWPKPLVSRHLVQLRQAVQLPRKRIKFTVTGVAGGALLLYFLIAVILYS